MRAPLPLDTDEMRALRNELGVHGAARQGRLNAIRQELDKPTPDLPAVILTVLELIK